MVGKKGQKGYWEGKSRTKETRMKVSEGLKRYYSSKEYRDKIEGNITHDKRRKFIRTKGQTIRYSHYIWLRDNNLGMLTIPKGWIVHHKDGNTLNDDIDNLICIPRDYHAQIHYKIELQNNPKRKHWGAQKIDG